MRTRKPKALTKVPTVKEYAAMTAKEQLEAANMRWARLKVIRAEARVLKAREARALIEFEAYPFKLWAEARWPEPYSVGKKRMQAIHEEMDTLK